MQKCDRRHTCYLSFTVHDFHYIWWGRALLIPPFYQLATDLVNILTDSQATCLLYFIHLHRWYSVRTSISKSLCPFTSRHFMHFSLIAVVHSLSLSTTRSDPIAVPISMRLLASTCISLVDTAVNSCTLTSQIHGTISAISQSELSGHSIHLRSTTIRLPYPLLLGPV